MAKVAVIGLGNMGATLARAFAAAGHDVTGGAGAPSAGPRTRPPAA